MDDFEREIRVSFLDEAQELLANTEQCFLNLERDSNNPEIIEQLFRLAHNLKGSAGAVGFVELKEFTHKLESLLLKIKNKELKVSPPLANLLLQCNDYLRWAIETLKADPEAKYENLELSQSVENATQGIFAESAAAAETPALTEEDIAPIIKNNVTAAKAPADENIRVSLSKLDDLLNNVGELVILQTVLFQQKTDSTNILMQKTISQMGKAIKEIQMSSMSLRMLPIRQTFQKMQRIVRDTSKSLGKDIDFALFGEEIELDKTVIEQLGDPLVHLIRNAVDHGIETPAERISLGKKPQGYLKLAAFHRGSQIVIEITEDGKGLDPKKLIAIAVQKGLLTPEQKLSETEAHMLIFAPGFSTKTEVTDVSGRGVGMDVVKTNIQQLQGEIEVETKLGHGTCFRIVLPMTLAITDGMVVRLGEDRYVIPMAQIAESLQPKKEDISYIGETGEVLVLRGESMPLYRLAHLLQRNTKAATVKNLWDGIALVVRGSGNKNFAVWIDEIICQQQVVIKRLGEEIRSLQGISGAAILGDGRASLILDLVELTQARVLSKNNKKSTNHAASLKEAS